MKFLTRKQQQRLMLHLVATAKLVHPSNCFEGDLKSWENWANETTNLISMVDGLEGLSFLELKCGITSMLKED